MLRATANFTTNRPRLVILAWFCLAAIGVTQIPTLPGLLLPGGFENVRLESEQAYRIVREEIAASGPVIVAVFRGPDGSRADAAFIAQVSAQARRAAAVPEVQRVLTPDFSARQVAAERGVATALIVLSGDAGAGLDAVEKVRAALGTDPLTPVITGGPVAYADIIAVSESDLRRAEIISVPLALIALALVFGTLVAAATPVVVGGVCVVGALALLAIIARSADLSVFVLNLATMLGLGLGTDYSLFLVSRFREELLRTTDVREAIVNTVETAGSAILFSGLAVFAGLCGLLTFEFMMLRSLGVAGAIVVILAVGAAVTLLPAILMLVGRRIDALRIAPTREGEQTAWIRLTRWAVTRPLVAIALVVSLLTVLGLPFLRARISLPDASVLPSSVPSRQAYDVVTAAFGPGAAAPILVVVSSDNAILAPPALDALYDLSRAIRADPAVAHVDSIVDLDSRLTREQYHLMYRANGVHADPYARAALDATTGARATMLTVTPTCSAASPECEALVDRLRAFAPGGGLRMSIGGAPAGSVDISRQLYADFPRAIAVVLAATFLILLVLLRSLILPIKAVLMNCLSLFASYGALVVLFQEGVGSGILGFTPLGYVEATLPIILFCLLFGLSMDYEVFLLSRIREEWLSTRSNVASVERGIARSGRVITNAALIVVLVSLSFASAEIILVKAVGIGAALAIALDATVVRGVLVPATMRLIGEWNWWLPGWLDRRLPEIGPRV